MPVHRWTKCGLRVPRNNSIQPGKKGDSDTGSNTREAEAILPSETSPAQKHKYCTVPLT